MGRSLPSCALALALALPAAPARADRKQAEAHFTIAVAHVRAGRHRDAIREFEEAYLADASPNLLFNIAQEYRALAVDGEIDDARKGIDYYKRYLAAVPAAPDRREVEAHIVELEARIAILTERAAKLREEPLKPVESAPSPKIEAPRPEPIPALATAPPPAPVEPTPLWKKWQLWVGVGAGVVVLGGASALTAAYAPRPLPIWE